MHVLISGAEGFAGRHLIRHLLEHDPALQLHGTVRWSASDFPHLGVLSSATELNLCDPEAVLALLDTTRPDFIYHLAAQAFVPRSFEAPWETLENNVRSQVNLLQGVIQLGLAPRILVVSSAAVYGAVAQEDLPITEDQPFLPSSPYSVSKVAQDMLGLQYYLSHQLPIVRVRPFNHIGPGQHPDFVAPAFAMQVARIELGLQEPVIEVGDLSTRRDFTDVRDVVRAYRLALTQGQPGAVYNVCSGRAHSIQEVLDTLLGLSSASVGVRVDPERLRAVDRPLVLGSAARLKADTGWQPRITFQQSLQDVLAEARERVLRERQQSQT